MKPSRISTVLTRLIGTPWPVFLWGPPGVGKSSVVQKVARDLGLDVLDVRAALLDPTDIRGIPYVADGVARWCPPSFLPSDPESKGLLFFDELSSAPPLVQASLYQLTLDRRVGEYVLPRGWSIMAAGNRSQDGAIVFRMPSALSNRFVHLDFEVDLDDWREWAIRKEIHPLVIAFLSVRPTLLFRMEGAEHGFASPRSWEMASDTLKAFGNVSEVEDLLIGLVGEGPSIEFFAFLKDSRIAALVEGVLADPDHSYLPDRLDYLFALVHHLCSQLAKDYVLEAALKLIKRLEPEMSMVIVRDIAKYQPTALLRPEARAFISKNKSELRL
jgi:MoxR-like ATPase